MGGNRLLWIGGDGSARTYVNVGSWSGRTWFVARPLDGPDTLFFDNTNYVRKLKGGTRAVFNAQGYHIQTINRQGRITQFGYDASHRLTSLTVPPAGAGLGYTFTYGGPAGTLSSVAAPDTLVTTSRMTSIAGTAIAGGARVTAITDPGTSASVQFGYAHATHAGAITSRTDRRGATTSFTLGTGLKLVGTSLPVPGAATIAHTFCPAEVWIWTCGSGLTSPESTYTVYDGPRTDSLDITHVWLDTMGAVTRVRDPYAQVTVVARADARFPILPTRVQSPSGRVLKATYDARGNLASVTDSARYGPTDNPVTSYSWNQTWDALAQVTLPNGQLTRFNINAADGNVNYTEDARGTVARTNFTYYPAGNDTSSGLIQSVILPGGATTTFTYDIRGNVQSSQSPLGWTTYAQSDRLGRPSVVRTPLGPTPQSPNYRSDTTAYDARGLAIRTSSYGPPFAPPYLTQLLTVVDSFDVEGRLIRRDRVGSAPGNPLTTRWTYDAAGRPIVEAAPDGGVDSTFYDPGGNPVQARSRRGHLVTMSYDRMNRLVRRELPSVTYIAVNRGIDTIGGVPHPYPWFPNDGVNYTIPGDTATFGYDVAGNLIRADNGDARVRRGYFRSNQVEWDSLYVRTFAGVGDTAFGAHRYRVSYAYDLNGRLVTLRHPPQLAPRSSTVADSVRYVYDPVSAELTDVYDLQNNRFSFLYSPRGERIRVSMPGNVVDTLAFDADGRLVFDQVRHSNALNGNFFPQPVIRQTQFDYSDPIRVQRALNAAGWLDTTAYSYSGLGHLVALSYSRRSLVLPGVDQRLYNSESFGVDALGNTTASVSQSNVSVGTSYTSEAPVTRNMWFTAAGRLRRIADASTRTDSVVYNAAGDVEFIFSVPNSNPLNSTVWYENRASFYDAGGRLRAAEWRSAAWTRGYSGAGGVPEGLNTWQMSFEQYRYDALGRRVLVREQRTSNFKGAPAYPIPSAHGVMRRTVWAGDQELWEIQMPDQGAFWENDTLPVAPRGTPQYAPGAPTTDYYFDPHPRYGRVGYVYGTDLDRPLSVTKFQQTDWAWPQTQVATLPPFTVVPHWNSRGQADYGLFADGTYRLASGGRWVTTRWRHRAFRVQQDGGEGVLASGGQTHAWLGTLLQDKEDGTGTVYRRNRYVDPITGQFTQEDPIGLGGGLNLYGFGSGDPVNFSDPFGLRVCFQGSRRELRRLAGDAQWITNTRFELDADNCAAGVTPK